MAIRSFAASSRTEHLFHTLNGAELFRFRRPTSANGGTPMPKFFHTEPRWARRDHRRTGGWSRTGNQISSVGGFSSLCTYSGITATAHKRQKGPLTSANVGTPGRPDCSRLLEVDMLHSSLLCPNLEATWQFHTPNEDGSTASASPARRGGPGPLVVSPTRLGLHGFHYAILERPVATATQASRCAGDAVTAADRRRDQTVGCAGRGGRP